MPKGYNLHEITIKQTVYRDNEDFKPQANSGYKTKRWKIEAVFRDATYKEGVTHPDDEFVEWDENTSFTEWRKEGEDFDPIEFLVSLMDSMQELADIRKYYEGTDLLDFCTLYGNRMCGTMVDDSTLALVEHFGKHWGMPTLNIIPFSKATQRYYKQTYIFYSNCKLLLALFARDNYNILGDIDNFLEHKYKLTIDAAE